MLFIVAILLFIGCCGYFACGSSFVSDCCLLLVVCCLLFVGCCLMFVVAWKMFAVRCEPVSCFLLFVVCCLLLLLDVCCLMFGVC